MDTNNKNQCDGCARGLEIKNGLHHTKEGRADTYCSKERYVKPVEKEEKKCICNCIFCSDDNHCYRNLCTPPVEKSSEELNKRFSYAVDQFKRACLEGETTDMIIMDEALWKVFYDVCDDRFYTLQEYKTELIGSLNEARRKKPLWDKDENRYLENIARENTFGEVIDIINYLKNE